MKKEALLLTLLCVGALNGMEPEQGRYKGLGKLSAEIQVMIVQFLNEYDNPDDVIHAIKATSRTNKQLNAVVNDMYGDLAGFTKLVHILADKFNKHPIYIALKFKTPVAKEYSDLYTKLDNLVLRQDVTEVKNLLNEGLVDVNAGPILYKAIFLLMIGHSIAAMIKLLLEYGANPNAKGGINNDQTALDFLSSIGIANDIYKKEAKELLEEAMKKEPK